VSTPAKVEANRRNAARSTGPRTLEGKASSSKNSLRHGLLSREVLLPDESRETLGSFGKRLQDELRPVGELEVLLVDRIVSSAWRLRRVLAVEAGLFNPPDTEETPMEARLRRLTEGYGEDETERAVTLSETYREDAYSADAFSRLSRYEAGIERSLFRALHELQRLQAARAGTHVPPPVAVDVDLALPENAGAEV